MRALLRGLETAGRWTEDLLLSGILLAMIGLAAWQILGRNVFGSTLIFGDVTRSTELWMLPEGISFLDGREGISTALSDRLEALAPIATARTLEPLTYSRLR